MVTCTWYHLQSPKVYNEQAGGLRIIAVDYGMKNNQIRCLVKRGASVKVVPWNYNFNDEEGKILYMYTYMYMWILLSCICLLSVNYFVKGQFCLLDFDGLFFSNGPGDPSICSKAVEHIRQYIGAGKETKPVFGICLGHQLLCRALGAPTFKMKLVQHIAFIVYIRPILYSTKLTRTLYLL